MSIIILCVSCSSAAIDSDGYSRVMKNGKYGLLDRQKRQVLPYDYDSISLFTDGVAIVKKDGRCGAVNTSGKMVIQCNYLDLLYDEGLFVGEKAPQRFVLITNSRGYYSELNSEYSSIGRFGNDSLTYVQSKSGVYGMINKTGEQVVPFISEAPFRFDSNGHACVKQDGKYGVIDSNLFIVVPVEYENNDIHFEDNIAIVKQGGRYGAVEIVGNKLDYIVPCAYNNQPKVWDMIKNRWLWGIWLLHENVVDAFYSFHSDGTCSWIYKYAYPIPRAEGKYSYSISGDTIELHTDDDIITLFKSTETELLVESSENGVLKKKRVLKISDSN